MNKFELDKSNLTDILNHLVRCDKLFNTPLSKKVDMLEYSKKIFTLASRVEYWDGMELRGLIAIYLNDFNSLKAFITNVTIENNLQSQGLGSKMLNVAFNLAVEKGFKVVSLEVDSKNIRAIRFYETNGFVIIRKVNSNYLMGKKL